MKRGPYAYNGNNWVGYDDPEMIYKKVRIYFKLEKMVHGYLYILDLRMLHIDLHNAQPVSYKYIN